MFGHKAGHPSSDQTPQRIRTCLRAPSPHLLTGLAFVAALIAGAAPVRADTVVVTNIRADFDNDGILDTVSIVNDGHSSQVRVWLSHRARFRVLRVPDEVLSVVATDVNADGQLDVRASTRRHGVLVWLNHGRGHLRRIRPAPPTLAAKHRFGRSGPSGSSSFFARSPGDDDPPSGSLPDDHRSPYTVGLTIGANARSPDISPVDYCSNTSPRAPPRL